MTAELRWRASPHALRLLTVGVAALLLGLAAARPGVAALAAVPAAFLLHPRARRPGTVTLRIEIEAQTSFEGEPVPVCLTAELDAPADITVLDVDPAADVEWTGEQATAGDSASCELAGDIAVQRWGQRELGAAVLRVVADAGLAVAETRTPLGQLTVFPQPHPVPGLVVTPRRGGLVGEHRGRRAGAGVEFAGIRPFGPGDARARVNWPVSARTQRLHITERVAEQAVDAVLVVDTFTDIGAAGRSSHDLSVRGATGLAQALLRSHDRVGVVALGGTLSWLRPDNGTRHFYRIAAAMLDAMDRESYLDPDLNLLPPRAVPAGSQVVLFSPLLDLRVVPAIEALRMRGVTVTVVDVLNARPAASTGSQRLGYRMWRLERAALAGRLANLGVVIVRWTGHQDLATQLQPALTGRRAAAAR